MSLYGVIDYHVTLSEGHMIANHPIYGNTCAPIVATLIYLSQIYPYYIRGDRSPLTCMHDGARYTLLGMHFLFVN